MADRSAKLNFIMRLSDQVTAPLAKVKMGFSQLADQSKKYIKQSGIGLAGMVGAGVAISKAMEPALEQNRALGEVKSLGVAEDALDALNRKSLAFSIAYGANARDFVASAYSIEGAIKGLTGSQLATFTNASNVLAKATKTDADTMGSYVGTMYNLFKGQADAMGKGAWVERLGGQTALAVQLFRTSGAQIGDAFKAAGSLASTAGVDLAEQMAVLGTLSSTMEGGEAGGLYKAFFENVTGASEKLGMSFTDQQGRLLPMMNILEKLQGRFGDLSIEANGKKLRDAFGGEAARLITTLMNDTGRLANGMDQLGRVRGLEQASKMAKDMTDPWQQFLSVVQALRVVFGQVLIPLLSPLMERLVGVGNVLIRWTQLFPNIARVIGIATLGILGLVAAIAGLTVINGVIGMLSLLASPVALIVLGIAALVVAIGVVIYRWDELKLSFGNTAWFQALVTILTPVVLLFRVFSATMNVLWIGLQQIVGFGLEVVAWLSQLEVVTSSAKAIWDAFIWGLTNLSPFALIGKALKGLISLLNKIPGINIDANFGDLPAPPKVPELVASPPGQSTATEALQRVQPTSLAPLALTQPNAGQPAPPVQLQPSIQSPAPLVLAQPQVLPPAPLVLPQPNIQAPAPLALAQLQVLPPTPLVLPQPSIQAPEPLAPAQPQVLPPAPLVLPQPNIQVPAPLALAQPQVLPPGPIVLPQPAEVQLPAAQVALTSQEASEKGQRARQAINDRLPSISPRTAAAVPQGGLLRQIQNTQTVNRGAHVEKVEIHTGKAMTPLELENMIQMAAG